MLRLAGHYDDQGVISLWQRVVNVMQAECRVVSHLREVSETGEAVGSVLDVEMTILDKQSKGIPIDEQANDNVVHLDRFREADRLTDQTFDPCS